MQSVKNENVYSLFPNQRIQSSHGSAAAATPTAQAHCRAAARKATARAKIPRAQRTERWSAHTPTPDPDAARRGPNPPETHAAKRAACTDRVPPAPRSVCSHRTYPLSLDRIRITANASDRVLLLANTTGPPRAHRVQGAS
jgi:hypothetical protein